MTKADLADAIYRRHGALSRRESIALVDLIFKRIHRGLREGKPVKIAAGLNFMFVHPLWDRTHQSVMDAAFDEESGRFL